MKKILLIEDEQNIRENVRDILEIKGFKPFTASNGKEGVSLAVEIKPDLIICDILMPDMDGYQVKRILNERQETSGIPFFFLSAKSTLFDIRVGMNLGADDYLTKPFTTDELIKAIETRLSRINKITEYYENKIENTGGDKKFSYAEKILLHDKGKPVLTKIEDIILLKADGDYSTVHINPKGKIMVRKLLKEWEQILPEENFLRVHRNTIINLNYIEKIENYFKRTYILKVKNFPEAVQVSYRFANKIRTLLGI